MHQPRDTTWDEHIISANIVVDFAPNQMMSLCHGKWTNLWDKHQAVTEVFQNYFKILPYRVASDTIYKGADLLRSTRVVPPKKHQTKKTTHQ